MLVLDIQFIVGNNNQKFVKELVILQSGSIIPDIYYFKPPYPKEELNSKALWQLNYNHKFINGLLWEDGIIDYNQLPSILSLLNDMKIFVKGVEKIRFLKLYIKNADFVQPDIPKLADLQRYKIKCKFHGELPNVRCAVENTMNMYMEMIKNKMIE